jgi:uncharacterized protein YbbC (DUF1343 family)
MFKKILFFTLLFLPLSLFADIIVGAENLKAYIPDLKGKKVALVVNQSSMVEGKH